MNIELPEKDTKTTECVYIYMCILRKGIIRHGMCVIGSFVIRLTIVTVLDHTFSAAYCWSLSGDVGHACVNIKYNLIKLSFRS